MMVGNARDPEVKAMTVDPTKTPVPDREGLLTAFRAVRDALLAGDAVALRELYDEDFRAHSLLGDVEDRETVLAVYRQGGVHLDIFEVEDLGVEVIGGVGVLTGLGSISGSYEKTEFRHRVRFVDIFVWRDGRWRYHFSQSTEIAPGAGLSGDG